MSDTPDNRYQQDAIKQLEQEIQEAEEQREWLRHYCENDPAVMWAVDNASKWRVEWLNGEEVEWVFFTFSDGPSDCAWNLDDGWDSPIEFFEHYAGQLRAALQAATERAERAERDRDAAIDANHSVAVCAKHTADIVGIGCRVCDLEAAEAQVRELRGLLTETVDPLRRAVVAGDDVAATDAADVLNRVRAALSQPATPPEGPPRLVAARIRAVCPEDGVVEALSFYHCTKCDRTIAIPHDPPRKPNTPAQPDADWTVRVRATSPTHAELRLDLARLQLVHQGLAVIGEQQRVERRLVDTWRSLLREVGLAAEAVAAQPDADEEPSDGA